MKKLLIMMVMVLAAGMAGDAVACTGMYAGKGVTTDGSVLIGRTVDFSPYNATMYQQICDRGTQVAFNGQANKYRYVCAPKATSLSAGRYAGSAANEKGVILTGTITGATRDEALRSDPFVSEENGGVGEPYLPDYLIGNAATAREAVELLGEAIAARGHAGPEIYMVADTNEAWYVEVYTGHDWAAVKMPEDKVAVFGNHFNLRGVAITDDPNVILSPELVRRAVNEGFAVWTDGGCTNLDLYATFADRSSVEEGYANFRAWYGHRRFGDANLPAYVTNLLPELFFTPGHRIAPTNMFELMRARYEDMTDEELPTPRTSAAIRVIGTTKQGNCHVLQLDCNERTPANMRGTVWSCLGQAEHGVFHPINASQNYLPEAYTNDAQRTFGYDPNRAADAFRRLSALAQSNRRWYGQGVRDYWRAREEQMAELWPLKMAEAVVMDNAALLWDYTRDEEEQSFADAKTLYDKLMWYAADNNHLKGDGSGSTDGPTVPFNPFAETPDALEGPEDDGGSCTGFYVGKLVSADGTTLIGRTADPLPFNGPFRVDRYERGERQYFDGTVNTWAFHSASKVTSQRKGFYGGGTINEKGVMLTGTVTAETREEAIEIDPFRPVSDGGVGEPNLPDYMIGKAATAREAVEILGRMIAECGHAGAEIYMVADSNEAWYVEVYTGHQWAAVKMPEDKVAGFGNAFGIRGFNPNDTANTMCSPNLVKFAVDNEFARWEDEEEGIIDLMKTYSRPLWDNPNYRSYWIHRAWAPNAYADPYKTDTYYDLFFTPEHPVAITEVFELMRSRYEGSDHSPDEGENTDIRVIGTTRQQSSHVLQMRHDLPEEYRCTLWECLAQAEHSTYLPVCMAVKEHPDAYSRDQTGTLEYDPDRAADAFLRLDTLAELKRFTVDTYGVRQDVRPHYGAGVRAYWKAQEDRLVEEWPRMLAEWMARGEAGHAAATAYVNFNQLWTLADAKRLHDELAWYWAEFNCDLRDGGGATDVPTYPFASSVPTNAELGVSWTRWHRAEFDAYVDNLAGRLEIPSQFAELLVDAAKHAFDDVEDEASLNAAKKSLLGVVEALCEEIESPHDLQLPVITFFAPDFTEGLTSEVPNVFWNIAGPFDRVELTIDGTKVYSGDTRCGEGRWRDLCRPGIHRLRLTVGYGEVEVTASCFYTASVEEEEPAVLPRIDYFCPNHYVGEVGVVPTARWSTRNITSLEIWVDGQCVHISEEADGVIRLSQLRRAGPHIVYMIAHNVISDAEACFAYRTDDPSTPPEASAPLLSTAEEAPVIEEFRPDAYEASIWNTPYIHWNVVGEVDSLRLVIDDTPVFTGDGHVGSGRWLDLALLNVDELSGSHEVKLSVSNALGVATSSFTYACSWAEPPEPLPGSEERPWTLGYYMQAYTNGFGGLIITGEGAIDDIASTESMPWTAIADEITTVTISEGVTKIGRNTLSGLADTVTVNGVVVSHYRMMAGAIGMIEAPGGAIGGAEVETVKVAGGNAQLMVAVAKNGDPEATDGWEQAEISAATVEDGKVRLTVPADFANGYMILKTKDAEASGDGVKSGQTVGMLSVESSAKQAAVGVAWEKLGGGELTVETVLGAMELAEGDLIHVYDQAQKLYQSWAWTGEGWSGAKTVTASGTSEPPPAGEVRLPRGSTFWLERENTTQPIILAGRYVAGEAGADEPQPTIEKGSAEQKAWNLVANPKGESFDLNEVVKGDINAKDQILVPTEGAPIVYTYEGGAWGCMVNEKVDLGGGLIVISPKRSTAAERTTIPAGRGFWYISAGGKPSFEW